MKLPRLGTWTDPDTLDTLTAGEMASRLVQRIIRRWIFLGAITAVTFYVWVVRDPIWHHSPADTWNYFLSWLAVAIESVVGMFFFAQSIRDAVLIRRIFRELTEKVEGMAEQNLRMEREHGAEIAAVRVQVAELHAAIVGGGVVLRRGAGGRFVSVKAGEAAVRGEK